MENDRGTRGESRIVTGVMGGAIVVLGAVLAASLALLSPARSDGEGTGAVADPPAHVEAVEGSDTSRVTLTARAAQRIDLQTAVAERQKVRGERRLVIPYAALLYDARGATWTYTNPDDLIFERAAVTVDFIRGDRVVLRSGPDAGTRVVTVGAQELLGAEFGVGH